MTMRFVRNGHLGALALMLALALSACGGDPADAAPEPHTLRLAIGAWPGYFPAVIADRQGLMAEEGVRLDITPVRDTTRLVADFAGGRYDLITVSLGNAVMVSRTRPDVMVLLIANESAGGDKLLKQPGASLDAAAGAPLRLGTSLGGFGELFMRSWLERERIDPSRVIWTNVDAPELSKALAEGAVDVGHAWDPYVSESIEAGSEVIFTSAETPGLILDAVLVTRETVERHPEAVRAFVRAWFRASERWQADPVTGNALAAEGLGLDPARVTLDGLLVYGLDENRRVMRGGDSSPLASLIRRYADFFVERGSLSRPPEAQSMFDPGLLPAADEPAQ